MSDEQQRLQNLELKLMDMELELGQLNDVVISQQARIAALETALDRLRQIFDALQETRDS